MKKKTVYILILLTFLVMAVQFGVDYYRATFVSHERENILYEKPSLAPAAESAVVEEEKAISILISGDNLIHQNVLNEANIHAGGLGNPEDYGKGFDFKPLYAPWQELISQTDYAICNQASLVGANDAPQALSGYPLFNSPSALGNDLISLGFDGFNGGNNHLLDMGKNGLSASLSYWKSTEADVFGLYESQQDFQNMNQKIITVDGVKLAVLSYTAMTNCDGSKDGRIPYFTVNGTAVKKAMLEAQIKECKSLADAVFVLINWGNSEAFEPSDWQKNTAQFLADAGADVIVGTGPKVIQPIEWISAAQGNRKTLCAYSLGNFMCTMQYMQNLFGGVLCFEVDPNREECIINPVFIPNVIHYDSQVSQIQCFPLSDYTEEKFQNHGSNLLYGFGEYAWYRNILRETISSDFLPPTI